MRTLIAFILLSFFTGQAAAHGEDKPGPHQGIIRMPGAFHTEIIPEKHGLRVMLLDINFQNATVVDSSVSIVLHTKTGKSSVDCKPKVNYFVCPMDNAAFKQSGAIEVIAKRKQMQGAPVTYPLPLPKLSA